MSAPTRPRARRKVGRPDDGEDVREAILVATLRQLEATGSPHQVTIAAIVDEAGCTPPSLYHYWPQRELLLREASGRGWAQFRGSQRDAVADHQSSPGDPVERLRLRGRAYLEFALARPALFRVLFLEPQPGSPEPRPGRPAPRPGINTEPPPGSPAEAPPETGDALNDLVSDISQAMASGQLRHADPLTTALALWSAMHGVAALWTATPNLPVELAHAVGDLAQDAILTGLAVLPTPSCR